MQKIKAVTTYSNRASLGILYALRKLYETLNNIVLLIILVFPVCSIFFMLSVFSIFSVYRLKKKKVPVTVYRRIDLKSIYRHEKKNYSLKTW